MAKCSHEQLAAIGLSPQKIMAIKKIAYDIIDKKLDLKKLEKKSNVEIANILIQYKYIGQ
jgi:3-methyladenine DNA glycosylase/8-oxoguanine DNA glycosylase